MTILTRATIVLSVCILLGVEAARAEERAAPLCAEQLVRMSREELECLYRSSPPGPIPCGYARGLAVRWPGTCLAVPNARLTHVLWKGKLFDNCSATLLNRWCFGKHAIQAQVGPGPSWLDGGPSIIMDYGETSHVWRRVRDELRQVGPDIYLGVMYLRNCPEPKLKMFFVLETCPAAGSD